MKTKRIQKKEVRRPRSIWSRGDKALTESEFWSTTAFDQQRILNEKYGY